MQQPCSSCPASSAKLTANQICHRDWEDEIFCKNHFTGIDQSIYVAQSVKRKKRHDIGIHAKREMTYTHPKNMP